MTISSGISINAALQRANSGGTGLRISEAGLDGALSKAFVLEGPEQRSERLALAIVGPDAEAADLELAHRVAEAEATLQRVRLITSHLMTSPAFAQPERVDVVLRGLTALQRHQRRALAQRNAAVRALDERAVCSTSLEDGATSENAEAMGAQVCVTDAASEETDMANEAEHEPDVATSTEELLQQQGASDPEPKKKAKPKANKKSAPKAKRSAPARKVEKPQRTELQRLFGAPPVLDHESLEEYDALHERIRAAVGTRDFIAEFLARDLCDLTWEILRLRRMKAKFLNNAMAEGLRRLFVGREVPPEYIAKWRQGDPYVIRDLPKWLKELGLDMEDACAQAAIVVATSLGQFDTVIHQAEIRRNAVLRDADRHQDAPTRRLQEITVEIEDAEFRQLEAGELAP